MHLGRSDASADGGMPPPDHSRDGDSRVPEICVILSVGCVLSTAVVGLRSYTRLAVLRTFGLDDGVMVASQALGIGSAVAIGLESKYGLGHHTWVQPKEQFVPYMKSFYSSIVLYNVAMCLVKISILLQYRRLFGVRMMQLATFYGALFLTAWSVTLCFLLTLVCVPVAKFWDDTIPGRCLDSLSIWYVMAGVNLATDFATFCLPLPVIRSLPLPRKQKIMLSAVFGLGLFTCIISIVRIHTLKMAASSTDPNWDNVDAAIWSFLEVTIAVLAACLPTLRPIFSKILPRLFTSSIRRSQGRSQYGAYVHTPGSNANWSREDNKAGELVAAKPEGSESPPALDSIQLGTHEFRMLALRDNTMSPSPVGGSGAGKQ